jgi:predicted  nucleic acid-binding Zn-ribbon protein
MNEVNDELQTNNAAPRWVGLAVALLAAFSLLGLGVAWSASTRTKDAIAQQQNAETELRALRQHVDGLATRLEQGDERTAQIQGELSVVTDRLKLTQGELSRARAQARQIKEEYAKQLATMEEQVKTELAAKADAESVEALNGQVSGVRSDLDATASQLNMARGELGTLIARNSDEISQLRRLGQRDYFEFTLSKKGERAKLGHVMVELRGTNSGRNQFTVALYADDRRLEKKNRAVNEPIYFYTRGYRAPLELVVNEVGKNKVVGYVSVPRSASTGTGSGTW